MKTWNVTVEQTVALTVRVAAPTLKEARDAVREDLASDWDGQSIIDWSSALEDAECTSTDVAESLLGDVEKDYMTDEAPEFTVKDGRLAAIEETAHGETNQ